MNDNVTHDWTADPNAPKAHQDSDPEVLVTALSTTRYENRRSKTYRGTVVFQVKHDAAYDLRSADLNDLLTTPDWGKAWARYSHTEKSLSVWIVRYDRGYAKPSEIEKGLALLDYFDCDSVLNAFCMAIADVKLARKHRDWAEQANHIGLESCKQAVDQAEALVNYERRLAALKAEVAYEARKLMEAEHARLLNEGGTWKDTGNPFHAEVVRAATSHWPVFAEWALGDQSPFGLPCKPVMAGFFKAKD